MTAETKDLSGALKIALIIKREFLERIRTKAFVIGTLLGPVILGGIFFVPVVLATLAPEKPLRMAVVDETGLLYAALDEALASDPNTDFMRPARNRRRGEGAAGAGEKIRRYQLEKAEPGPEGREALLSSLTARVEAESLDAYLVLPPDALTGMAEPTYYGRTVSEIVSLRRIEGALTEVVIARRLASEGVDSARAKDLTRRADLQTVKLGAKGQQSRRGFREEYLATMVYVMFLYTTLIMYGSALARSLIEEKMNRVMEILLSSVTPFQLMAGKIVGIGSVGLVQFLIWSGAALGLSLSRGLSPQTEEIFSAIEPATLAFFVLFFILGYFIYASLFCIVGAMCTSEQEAQSAQMPVVMLLVIPMISAIALVRQPAGTLGVVMSHVPFFSPIVMFMRIQMLTPPAWEIALNVVLMIATIAGTVWVAARIFRVGILMTGKRATIPEVVRWLRTS